jgi:hypothetical protein
MKSCLKTAEKKIIPSVWANEEELHHPDNFNLLLNKHGIDPFSQYSQLPRMAYLNDLLGPETNGDEGGDEADKDQEREPDD